MPFLITRSYVTGDLSFVRGCSAELNEGGIKLQGDSNLMFVWRKARKLFTQ